MLRMICKACDERWDLLWRHVNEFDKIHSWEWELWEAQPPELNSAYDEALEIESKDAEAARAKVQALAETGYPFALSHLGYDLWSGQGVEKDLHEAASMYERAVESGSWLSLIYYARIQEALGRPGESARALENGVLREHLPSYFWSAFYRWGISKSRKERRKVCYDMRPLLEELLRYDHAGARWFLARAYLHGYFGIGAIPKSWGMLMELISQLREEEEEEEEEETSSQVG